MAAFFREKFFNLNEDEINFDSFIKVSILLFRIFGFNFEPLADGASIKSKIVYRVKTLYAWTTLTLFSMGVLQLVTYALNADNSVEAICSVEDGISVSLIVLKTTVTFLNKNKIWEILETMKSLFDSRENGNHNVKKYLDNYLRIVKVGAIIFLLCFPPVFYLIIPYLINGTMKLPSNFWFPFDVFQVGTFPLALLWIDWITTVGQIFYFASDSLLYALITVIAMEFDLLKQDLLDLKLVSKAHRQFKVARFTDRHNNLLDLVDKLQEAYSPIFLGNLVISSMLLCFCSFLLSTGEFDFATNAFYISCLTMFTSQVFLLCMISQKVNDSSLSVANGAYECDWTEDDDIDFKKHIHMIILRAQRLNKLTAMKFAEVSLESFTTVIKLFYKFSCFTFNYYFSFFRS